MKITLGEWKTRDGRKAVVAAENPNACKNHRLIGWIDDTARSWREDGLAYEGFEFESDLIAPWIDPVPWDWSITPPWFDAIVQGPSGQWYLCESIVEVKERGIAFGTSRSSAIPIEYWPKWSGDWKLSKTQRPKDRPSVEELLIHGKAARAIIINVKNIIWRKYSRIPLWSLVADITGHGSGYSNSICLSANLNPHQTITAKPLKDANYEVAK